MEPKKYDFSTHLFRCSGLGNIMTDGKGMITEKQLATIKENEIKILTKPLTEIQQKTYDGLIYKRDHPELGDTCKDYLIQVYIKAIYGREKDITTKYLEKGLTAEEDAITLYSRVKKKMFKKNDKRIKNKWVIGEPDLYDGEELEKSNEIIDTKASWDLHTFLANHVKKSNPSYFWQTQGYSWLTGAKVATVAYCLVNTPKHLIEKEKRYLMYDIGEDHPNFLEACKEIENKMIFDDIPKEKKVITISTPFDPLAIEKLQKRIVMCRKFLNALDL